jgi:hypothetical protein
MPQCYFETLSCCWAILNRPYIGIEISSFQDVAVILFLKV